jgi:eukaryotic-like serine/threonine-protein kinase
MVQALDVGLSPDDRIGNYRVEHELGPTGSGVLLQARHQVLPRRAIIKVVHAAFAGESPYLVQTLREACILEAISHPGVPIVYESGLLPDRRPWFAFELIHGPTLDDLLVPRALPIPEIAHVMRDLADILEHAHRRGVIHRGLRPDRIVMTSQRRYPLCIPDWSEAIAHDASASVPPPDGSRAYLAPELVHQDAGGAERVDDRADMFALGAIAYRALTGTLPFNPVAANVPYLAARTRRPDTPRDLATIIDSLLSFDRFDRPSASEVRAELDLLLGSLPELQRHAAPRVPESNPDFDEDVEADGTAPPVATRASADVSRGAPRVRRPRWTPTVQYVDSTDVDINIDDDAPAG